MLPSKLIHYVSHGVRYWQPPSLSLSLSLSLSPSLSLCLSLCLSSLSLSICICTYMCMYIQLYTYTCIYIYTNMGVCRKGGLSRPAPRALCYIPLVTATCYIPPVADLRCSDKPCLKVVKLKNLVAQTHLKQNLHRCQWSRWLAQAILLRNIWGGML